MLLGTFSLLQMGKYGKKIIQPSGHTVHLHLPPRSVSHKLLEKSTKFWALIFVILIRKKNLRWLGISQLLFVLPCSNVSMKQYLNQSITFSGIRTKIIRRHACLPLDQIFGSLQTCVQFCNVFYVLKMKSLKWRKDYLPEKYFQKLSSNSSSPVTFSILENFNAHSNRA